MLEAFIEYGLNLLKLKKFRVLVEKLEKCLVESVDRYFLGLAIVDRRSASHMREVIVECLRRISGGMGELGPPKVIKDKQFITKRSLEGEDLLLYGCVKEKLEVYLLQVETLIISYLSWSLSQK